MACHAYRSASFTYSAEADIVFDTEAFDLGGDFNTTTGQFTAPVAGYYHISANLGTSDIGDGQQTILRVYANGSAIALATGVGSAAGSDPRIHTSVLTFLDAGHIVKATANSSASTQGSGSTNTFISIFLVGQD